MTARQEALRKLVLRACADNYESLELITIDVTRFAVEAGLPVEPKDEIKLALQELMASGLTAAYRFSGRENVSSAVEYSDEAADELWFYITPAGIKHLQL